MLGQPGEVRLGRWSGDEREDGETRPIHAQLKVIEPRRAGALQHRADDDRVDRRVLRNRDMELVSSPLRRAVACDECGVSGGVVLVLPRLEGEPRLAVETVGAHPPRQRHLPPPERIRGELQHDRLRLR